MYRLNRAQILWTLSVAFIFLAGCASLTVAWEAEDPTPEKIAEAVEDVEQLLHEITTRSSLGGEPLCPERPPEQSGYQAVVFPYSDYTAIIAVLDSGDGLVSGPSEFGDGCWIAGYCWPWDPDGACYDESAYVGFVETVKLSK